jgi:ABC-2 type transport system permease protein
MPIYELGYRGWEGRLVAPFWRFCAIAETGIRLAWRSKALKRTLLGAWLPVVYIAFGFFLYEQILVERGLDVRMLQSLLPSDLPKVDFDSRHEVWSTLLWVFYRYPQAIVMALVVGVVAPPLISRDVKSRAFLLYFSKPLARWEYLLGKMGVVWAYLVLISVVPALTLYLIGVVLSPVWTVVLDTWDLPLRILGASVVLTIPTTVLALVFSSLTAEPRHAGYFWFATWVVGWVGYGTILTNLGEAAAEDWSILSLYHTLGKVQSWVFGRETSLGAVAPSMGLLAGITLVSLVVLYRRISSPMRI